MPIIVGDKKAIGILINVMQALQLYGRMNQLSRPSSETKTMEFGSANVLEEYDTLNHDEDVHIKSYTVDGRLGEKL